MAIYDKRVDEYIKKSAPFAQPILQHLRELVHNACPEVEETIKWGMPSFEYKGPFCGFASFKAHASFGFWKASLMKDAAMLNANQTVGMGHLGKLNSLKDLPSDKKMMSMLLEAMRLNDEGIKVPKIKKEKTQELEIPEDLKKALSKNKKAQKIFTEFVPSHRKEYILWITDAKRDETRAARILQTVEWVSEGKGRNWKYER